MASAKGIARSKNFSSDKPFFGISSESVLPCTSCMVMKCRPFGPIVNVAGVGDISGIPNADHPKANFSY